MDIFQSQSHYRCGPKRHILHFRHGLPRLSLIRLAPGQRIACSSIRVNATIGEGASEDVDGVAFYVSQLQWREAFDVGYREGLEESRGY